jgi:hypothetical protein
MMLSSSYVDKNLIGESKSQIIVDKNLLPNLLIIGAGKAGTTALHEYLSEHPQIFMTQKKEPRFFLVWENPEQMRINERENHNVFNKYNTIEKYTELFVKGKDCLIRGESSPQYLSYAHCADKIKKLVPEVKIIAILRNPVERAFSHYIMNRNWRIEKKEFDEAIDEEIKTRRLSYPHDMRYLYWGKYVGQLNPYLSLFSSNQLRIYVYDDFKADSINFLKNIFNFLGVDDSFTANVQNKHNVSFIRRYQANSKRDKLFSLTQRGFRKLKMHSLEELVKMHRFHKPFVKPETKKKLIDYFTDEISELEKLLGRDLSKWRA